MVETLDAYKQRTVFMWDSLPQSGCFFTNDNLRNKVTDDGKFKPFYGDTVIFSLDKDAITWLSQIQNETYRLCGNILSDKLNPATFHITLHDLKSNPYSMPNDVKGNEHRAVELIEYIKKNYRNGINLNSRCVFSMVGTSIVMGFDPATQEDCNILMNLYEEFQSIVPLSYPLTLHTTIAYYKPGNYDENTLWTLRNSFDAVRKEPRKFRLDLNKLNYATFSSMDSYSLIL
ncbi:hypothetical protein B5F08_08355 [Anaeromassilibacillus sp. An172]|uniref:hypothetical protein n=1 Tax=Anaeromassilibacillus sp. An172 TaxID=1965570 RepID=UPI000B37A41E|nr:hypothetical protein [Anaeromassilibacillus sp. An172]OUP77561.1 hypothetical protein B5F08_08355 [Anaeromassilibacillus sp. An172]